MTDASLVTRAAGGDRQAWRQLVQHLSDIPWGVARALGLSSEDAGQVVTVTWLRLVDRLDRFVAEEEVAPFVAATAFRETTRLASVLRLVRSGARHAARADGPDAARAKEGNGDRDRLLYLAYLRLPARSRLLLRLVVSGRLHYREISDALAMPIGSIGPTRQRGFHALRKALEGTGGSSP